MARAGPCVRRTALRQQGDRTGAAHIGAARATPWTNEEEGMAMTIVGLARAVTGGKGASYCVSCHVGWGLGFDGGGKVG